MLTFVGIFSDRMFASPVDQRLQFCILTGVNFILIGYRFDVRGRIGMHTFSPVSHSPLASPTPAYRDTTSRLMPSRIPQRMRTFGSLYGSETSHLNMSIYLPPV